MTKPPPIPISFFEQDPVWIARQLLGGTLVRPLTSDCCLTGCIVEVEAYDCPRDPACTAGRFHAARSAEMAIQPGLWLFWMAHGHPLLQISCRPKGVAASVLIRAIEPLEGREQMLDFRPVTRERDLTNGPAKLVYAFGIDPLKTAHTRIDSALLHLTLPLQPLPDEQVEITSRIGIRAGKELPWRFIEKGNPWVSPATPSNPEPLKNS